MRILLVGSTGDSPGLGTGACTARTERFRSAMEMAGIDVTVSAPAEGSSGAGTVVRTLRMGDFRAVIMVSPFPAEAALLARPDLPVWIDMNGMHPAEIQLQAARSNRGRESMLRILALENLLLCRGDRFSTPSRRQAAAVMGELYLLGRLGGGSAGEVPVSAIPHCAMSGWEERFDSGNPEPGHIISTGSFNLWFDHETLFRALELAMKSSPAVRFTCTGGSVPLSPEKYAGFRRMVEGSRFQERFHLRGWVDRGVLEETYSRASAAVYTDIPGGETMLGARTRTLDWIARGIPVICTRGAEISQDIESGNLGIVVPQSDAEALGRALLEVSLSPGVRGGIVRSQKTWCKGPGNMETLFEPLIRWCSHPRKLPGKAVGRATVPPFDSFRYLTRLFGEVRRDRGIGNALYRVLEKLVPGLKHSRKEG